MKISLFTLIIIMLSGCASIVGDKEFLIKVKSDMPDVKYQVINKNGKVIDQAVTPSSVYLKSSDGYFSKAKYTIKSTKDGYSGSVEVLNTSLSNWYLFGNILFGGLVGWFIVDPLTGAMYTLPKQVTVSAGNKLPEQNNLKNSEEL